MVIPLTDFWVFQLLLYSAFPLWVTSLVNFLLKTECEMETDICNTEEMFL